MGFKLLGWPAPQNQHDVAELIDFLHHRLIGSTLRGQWESRGLSAEGLALYKQATAHKCMRLPWDPSNPSPNIQDSITLWHQQVQLQGLSEPSQWLFLQLPRFQHRPGGRVVKLQHAYLIPQTLSIPVFKHLHNLEVDWVNYTVAAYIQHHGPEPTSGHYTTVVRDKERSWLLDDENSRLSSHGPSLTMSAPTCTFSYLCTPAMRMPTMQPLRMQP